MDKKKILFVRANFKDSYVYDAIKHYGFEVVIPYKDTNIVMRLLREAWFKLKLPKREILFNKKVANTNADTIIVHDPLITSDYLNWVISKNPQARIILAYTNRADSTIDPDKVDKRIEKWSYDKTDCEKYGMKFVHPSYLDCYSFDSTEYEKKYDVLYLGRDKGRLSYLEQLEKDFNKLGLSTYFRICANRAHLRYKNKKYKKELTYKEYISLMKHSKAILNIQRTDQNAITERELEAAFNGVKCISNNKYLKEFELYDPSRYFILGYDDIREIVPFINGQFLKVDPDKLDKYRFQYALQERLEKTVQ